MDKETAWDNWAPALTDLDRPTPSYWEAFDAGWNAAYEEFARRDLLRGLAEADRGEVVSLGSFASEGLDSQ